MRIPTLATVNSTASAVINDSLEKKKIITPSCKSDEIPARDRLLTHASSSNMTDGLFTSPASFYRLTFFFFFLISLQDPSSASATSPAHLE